jgi:uncharacterized repeat protein (TIGR01451 family)
MKRILIGTIMVIALLGVTAPVHALGTNAGTVIQNQAMATYDIGTATNLTAYSGTVYTTVDELIDVAVAAAPVGTTYVFTLPAANQPLLFTVTNNGNGTEPFDLTIVEAGSPPDDFDTDPPAGAPATPGVEIYIDNGDGIFTSTDPAYGTSLTLTEDQIADVWVIQDIPAGAGTAGEFATITPEAAHLHAVFSTVPGTSYTGEGDGGGLGDAVLGANGGFGSASMAYQITLTTLNMAKSFAVAGTNPVPGATITYTIDFSVSGSGGIDNLVITDPVPTNTTFVGPVAAGPIAADSAGLIGNTVTVSYASTTISAGSGTQTITFDVTID